MRQTSSLLLGLFAASALPCVAQPPKFAKPPTPPAAKAVKVGDFLDSLGVCTHIAQGADDPTESAACLTYAGLRNLRDDGSLAHVKDWIAVYKASGVRTCLLTNHNVADTITMAKQLQTAGALLAVEGPNEPNNWPVEYEGQKSGYETTALPIARFQRDLYAAVKAEPTLRHVPVFHSSEAGGSEKDNVGLQFLRIPVGAKTRMPDETTFADFANTHNYVCGHSHKLVDNVSWNATSPTLNGDWDGMYVEYGKTWHGHFDGYDAEQLATLPRVCTETGWTTRGDGSISEEQQARVFLNLYLDGFRQGWKYTFIYMLHDDPNQGYWGLFDTAYQPKKSATYLHNLTAILVGDSNSAATGAKRSPRSGAREGAGASLGYTLPDRPATVHDLLLQKTDGSLALVVWDERASGTDDVTVNFASDQQGVQIYDPTTGLTPTQTLARARAVKLALSDHPVVIAMPSPR